MKPIIPVLYLGYLLSALNVCAEDTIRARELKHQTIEEKFQQDLCNVFGDSHATVMNASVGVSIAGTRYGEFTQAEITQLQLALGLEMLSRDPDIQSCDAGILSVGPPFRQCEPIRLTRTEHKDPQGELDQLRKSIDWTTLWPRIVDSNATVKDWLGRHLPRLLDDKANISKIRAYMDIHHIPHVDEIPEYRDLAIQLQSTGK